MAEPNITDQDVVLDKPGTEPTDRPIPVNTLDYDHLGVWFVRLYGMVECKQEDREKLIETIVDKCNAEFPSILETLGLEEDAQKELVAKGVVPSDNQTHIRYPVIPVTLELEGLEPVESEIRIRINPCITSDHLDAEYKRHSKIWVIPRTVKPISTNGVFLSYAAGSAGEICRRLEELVAACYVPFLGAESSPVYDIFMKVGSLLKSMEGRKFRDMYMRLINDDNPELMIAKDPLIQNSLSDILRLSNERDEVPDDLVGDLQFVKDRRAWEVVTGGHHQSIYRMDIRKDMTDISGICRVRDESKRPRLTYTDFSDLALQYSWSL